MEKIIYEKEGYVKAIVKGSIVYVMWEKLFNAQTIYDCIGAQMEVVKQGGIKSVIVDLTKAQGTPPQECQKWFAEEVFTRFEGDSEFKGFINITPQNAITKMGAKSWKEKANSDQVQKAYEVSSLDEALKLVDEL